MSDPVRILLVDDHAVLRAGLRLLLEREEGLEPVGEAATAEDAIRALPRLAPDVVVLDIEMPGMGGIEGAALIRERPRTPASCSCRCTTRPATCAAPSTPAPTATC